MTGGLPNCQWANANGRYVQAVGLNASFWAQSLPEFEKRPQAVAGQACSAGVFTSVMVADQHGLDAPLPIEAVTRLLQATRRRAA